MINLDRLEKLESKSSYNEPKKEDQKDWNPYGEIEILTKNKVPFSGVSFERKGYYECPFCREYTIKRILEWRCSKYGCESKVIKWKCYITEKEERHEFYDTYIKNFYDNANLMATIIKEKEEHKNE